MAATLLAILHSILTYSCNVYFSIQSTTNTDIQSKITTFDTYAHAQVLPVYDYIYISYAICAYISACATGQKYDEWEHAINHLL